MLARIGKVATELLNYSNGIQSRLLTLQRIQTIGYSEQEAIFVLDILEDPTPFEAAVHEIVALPVLDVLEGEEPRLQDVNATETHDTSPITREEPSTYDQAKH